MKLKYTLIEFILILSLLLVNCNNKATTLTEEVIITNERNIDTLEYQKSINKDTTTTTTTVSQSPSTGKEFPNKGIGPIKAVTLGPVDQLLVEKGQEIYKNMCTACHKPTKKFIGPSPKGILDRRSPEWIMNMILNPENMILKDPIAKDLLIEFNNAPMANQNLSEDDARAVLEYFRTL